MKKIPTLFERKFEGHKIVGISDKLTDTAFQCVLDGECDMTIKFDGSCCSVIDRIFYKRFDAKPGRKIPDGAVPCCDPDPVTGHHPHWVAVNANNAGDKWFIEALKTTAESTTPGGSFAVLDDGHVETNILEGTYEAIGKHFNGNPYALKGDKLIKHGCVSMSLKKGPITFELLRGILETENVEGFVFWKDGEPLCKIKKTDFGFEWPIPDVMGGHVLK